MEEPSFPALALLTVLQSGHDQDSRLLQEWFSSEFPDSEYRECLAELLAAGLWEEPPTPDREPTKVAFQRLSPLHLRAY